MSSITLIATGHKEKGLCNSHELFKIIEQISPDVIFEEIPPSKFEAVYAGTRQDSLEVKTIKAYLQKYPDVHHYPVDLDIDQEAEKQGRQEVYEMSSIFNHESHEYYHLSRLNTYWTEKSGFPYLNTERCSVLMLRKKNLETQVLEALKNDKSQTAIDHERLGLAYKQWMDQIDDRENEMLINIYSYMEQKKYTRALFLVGAGHKKPIMQKIQEIESKEEIKLKWTFYNE
jgi:hypothetical protein